MKNLKDMKNNKKLGDDDSEGDKDEMADDNQSNNIKNTNIDSDSHPNNNNMNDDNLNQEFKDIIDKKTVITKKAPKKKEIDTIKKQNPVIEPVNEKVNVERIDLDDDKNDGGMFEKLDNFINAFKDKDASENDDESVQTKNMNINDEWKCYEQDREIWIYENDE